MTATGNGSASVAIRSNSPAPATSSIKASIICWIGRRMPSTIRGVNAFETSARTRVWSGGSMSRMPLRIRCQNGPCQSGSSGRPISACVATW